MQYDAGVGTIDTGDSNEELFFELDGDDYADNAEVVVSRTAHAPDGYNFVGWTIRGDTSGRVYYPGQTFVFKSRDAVTVNGKETIFLDAVYTRVGTASIVYDANGGTIDSETLDYGSPTDSSAPEPSTSYNTAAGTATISNLINNSEIRLSSGTGFSMEGATLVGWSTEPDYDPSTDTLFALGVDDGSGTIPTYYVDTEEPVTLYAVWQVKVYFHLNESTANANFGGEWETTVYTLEAPDLYSTSVYINNPVAQPSTDPVFYNSDNPDNLFFHYWGTMRYAGDEIEEYDFSQPVTGELHLYAYWDGPIQVPVHAVDASEETLVDKDDPWLTTQPQMIEIAASEVSLAAKTDADVYAANVPSGYTYAFAAVKSRTADLQTISEDNAITGLYYNSTAKKVFVRYKDISRADAPLADTDEVYLVYYKDPLTLNIGYKVMEMTGALNDPTRLRGTQVTTASVGDYNMQSYVTQPRYWAYNDYSYYAYAIGVPTATTSSQLQLITNSSNSDSSRPQLQIRNTWRGFQYSTDSGITWTNCGYDGDIQLYVVYFTTNSQPTIVTINEKTIGTASDMEEEFEYSIRIQKQTITRTEYANNRTWSNGQYVYTVAATQEEQGDFSNVVDPYNINLSDKESQSITLFNERTEGNWGSFNNNYNGTRYRYKRTVTETIQIVTITQTAKDGFQTTNTTIGGGTSTPPYIYTYTTTSTAATPSVTYTNTHTPLTVEVHVALVGGSGITLDDNERASTYTFTLPIDRSEDPDNTKVFLTELPSELLFTGDSTVYGFAGIVYGTSGTTQDDAVTVVGTDVSSITYAQMYPADASRDNVYEPTLNDSSSNTLDQLGSYKIYYLYYPLPKVVYVKETSGGELERISGSSGSSITYDGAPLTLNGVTVAQEQLLSVTNSVFTISQTVASGNFNMPPKLDDGTEKLFLLYTKVGVGGSTDITNASNLSAVTESKTMYLKVDGNQAKWSLDGTTWNAFTGSAPTVYAIYKEIGYDLRITKTVTGSSADPTRTFTLTIVSQAITESSYAVTGTGYSTVSATPASGSATGSITLTVKHGSDVTISGLSEGDYTITESNGAILTAEIEGEPQTVHNHSVDITLNANTKLDLFNEMVPVAPTGYSANKAPYAWMLSTGCVLALAILMGRRRRKEGGDGT